MVKIDTRNSVLSYKGTSKYIKKRDLEEIDMRAILAIVLLIASSGMIYASFTADAPVPGIDYDVQATVQDSCGAQVILGDRLLSFVSSGGSESVETPDKATGKLLKYLTCGLLDN